MKVLTINGYEKNINVTKYLVDWDEKSRSKWQFEVKKFLEPWWKNHLVCEEFKIPGCLLRCDYINFTKKIVVECQSRIHDSYIEHFHKSRSGYLQSFRRDIKKEEWVNKMEFTFVEIYPEDMKDLNRVWFNTKYNIDLI